MNACLQMRKVMLRKVNNLLKVIYLLLRETDPPKTKSGLFQRPVFFLLTVLFCGRCLSTLAMDLLENRLAVRPEKMSRFTLFVSKLGEYMGCLVCVKGLSLEKPFLLVLAL